VGIRPRSEQFVTSGLSLPVVRAGPEHRKVVHPCGSQLVPHGIDAYVTGQGQSALDKDFKDFSDHDGLRVIGINER
jgi:hypothetical protein